uniref:Uncharacterized protein n=1 Tax=Rhipicephalus zambeziensis TaxID=60191 RepID=A0A224YF95_9ACAR
MLYCCNATSLESRIQNGKLAWTVMSNDIISNHQWSNRRCIKLAMVLRDEQLVFFKAAIAQSIKQLCPQGRQVALLKCQLQSEAHHLLNNCLSFLISISLQTLLQQLSMTACKQGMDK